MSSKEGGKKRIAGCCVRGGFRGATERRGDTQSGGRHTGRKERRSEQGFRKERASAKRAAAEVEPKRDPYERVFSVLLQN